jgi:hypothetical protein
MNISAVTRPRIDPSRTTALLAVGDIAAILVFIVVGEYTHGYNPLVAVGRVAGTALPFIIGWAIATVGIGLYGPRSGSLGKTLGLTLLSWVVAVGIAQALRATAVFHGNAALTFALVSVGVGGVLLSVWRGAVAVFDLAK